MHRRRENPRRVVLRPAGALDRHLRPDLLPVPLRHCPPATSSSEGRAAPGPHALGRDGPSAAAGGRLRRAATGAVHLVLGGLGAACRVAVAVLPVGALLGGGFRRARADAAGAALFDADPLHHRCPRCGRGIVYFAFEDVSDVERIHQALYCVAARPEQRSRREGR